MEKTPNNWTIIDEEAGILAYRYKYAKGGISMTFAARMQDGRMLVVSPLKGLTDGIVEDLLKYGDIGALVANNGMHYLGLHEWQQRFPNVKSYAPSKAIPRIQKKSKHPLALEPLSGLTSKLEPNIGIREIPDTKIGETWCWAKTSDGGYAWYTSDVLINLTVLPKPFIPRMLFKYTKSGPGYSIFHAAMMLTLKNKKATLKLLLEDVEAQPPTVVVPAHGDILSQDSLAEDTKALIQAAL